MMQQIMEDEAGNLWKVDAAGNVIGPATSAAPTAGRVFTLPPNPKEVRQEARQNSADARAEAAARRQEAADKRQAEKDARAAREWNATHFPDGTPKPKDAAAPQTADDMAVVRAEALDKIRLARSLQQRSRDGYFTTGFGAGLAAKIGPTPARDVAADTETLSNAGALTRIMEMARTNGGKNPLTPLSNADFKALSSSLSNIDPTQSDDQYQRNVQRVIDLYAQAYKGAGGQDLEADLAAGQADQKADNEVPDPTNNASLRPEAPGLVDPNSNRPGGGPRTSVATGDTRTTFDARMSAQIDALINAGAWNTANDALKKAGYAAISPGERAAIQKWQKANPGQKYFGANISRNDELSMLQKAAATPAAAFVSHAGNAATAGILGAMAGPEGQGALDAMSAASPGSSLAGGVTGGIAGSLGGGLAAVRAAARFAPKAVSVAPVIGDTLYGAGYGFNTAQEGEGGMGALVGGVSGLAGGVLGEGIGRAIGRFGAPPVSGADRSILGTVKGQIDPVRAQLDEAQGLNMPFSIADADPRLRALGGAVSRKSVDARNLAERTFDPRAMGQAERAVQAIDQNLAPVGDITAIQREAKARAQRAANPLYEAANRASGLTSPELDSLLATPAGQAALARARTIALNERKDPTELGFAIGEDGRVILQPGKPLAADEAAVANPSPIQPVQPPNEADELLGRAVNGANGQKVNLRGPIDMTQQLRMLGGIRDAGGELRSSGITNNARQMPYGANEQFLGRLVDNERGMTLDDAAHALWERGYFPNHTERPTIRELLEALDAEKNGSQRFFRPEDADEVARYDAALENRYKIEEAANEGRPIIEDVGAPITLDDLAATAPPIDEGRLPETFESYRPETLDYVKRGLDDIIEGKRNPLTGKLELDTDGRAINDVRAKLVAELDLLNPAYKEARATYGALADQGSAARLGYDIAGNIKVTPAQTATALGKTREGSVDYLRQGYASAMADQAERAKLSGNPYSAIYGSPAQMEKVATVFPEGAQRFGRVADLEREMAKTHYEVLGGSPTAGRLQADQQIGGGLGMTALDVGSQLMTGGGLGLGSILSAGRNMIGDSIKLGIGNQAIKRADEIAPILYNTDPAAAAAYLDDLIARSAARIGRSNTAGQIGGGFGSGILTPLTVGQ